MHTLVGVDDAVMRVLVPMRRPFGCTEDRSKGVVVGAVCTSPSLPPCPGALQPPFQVKPTFVVVLRPLRLNPPLTFVLLAPLKPGPLMSSNWSESTREAESTQRTR